MPTFSSLFPDTFFMLAMAHGVALITPGPDFFLVTGRALRQRFAKVYPLCIGVALGNAIYIALAIAGWQGIRDQPLLFMLIESAGAIYLLWLGSLLLHSPLQPLQFQTVLNIDISLREQLLTGLMSALLNPKNALFYMSLMTVILGSQVTLSQQISCGIWMTCMVLVWNLGLVSVIAHPRVQQFLQQKIAWLEKVAGVMLMGFGISLLGKRILVWLNLW